MEAGIIRKVLAPGYAHAENVFHLLEHYKREMPHDRAVERLHSEVCDT